MKSTLKILATGLFLLVSGSAYAVCPTPLVVQDGNGQKQNMSTTDDASGNCMYNFSAGAATTGGSAVLAVTGSSSSVALPVAPSGSPSLRLVNNGPSDLFYNTGVGSATATTTPSATNQKLQACHSVIVNQGTATFIAAILASGSTATELDIYQDTAPVMLAGNCLSAEGTPADAAYGGSGNATIIGALKGLYAAILNGVGATGATTPTNAVVVGCNALSTEQTAVSTGQMTTAACGLDGKLVVLPYAGKEQAVKGTTSAMTGTTSTQLIAAVASNKIYLRTLTCGNSHATVGTFVIVQDGSAGTTLWEIPAATNYGGATLNFDPPLATTNGNGVFVVDVTTGANVICSGSGYSGL